MPEAVRLSCPPWLIEGKTLTSFPHPARQLSLAWEVLMLGLPKLSSRVLPLPLSVVHQTLDEDMKTALKKKSPCQYP